MKRNTAPLANAPVSRPSRAVKLQATLPGLSVPPALKKASVAATAAARQKPRETAPTKTVAKSAAKSVVTKDVKVVKAKSAAKAPISKAQPVRVVNEPVFAGGALWKMSGKNGVAYVKDAALAGELLATDAKNLAKAAMAVYYDKKGKAFAWQVRFDTDRWEEVMRRLA